MHILTIFIASVILQCAPCARADQQFKELVESTTKKIETEKPFYQELVENAKVKQMQYATDAQYQKSDMIQQIFMNNQNIEKAKTKQNNLIVFVSFSMPNELLLDYQNQIRVFGGRMVIRGLVDGSFKKTIAKLKLPDNKSLIVDINPKLFEQYQVTQVPAIVINDNNSFDKFTGSVSIDYALEQSKEHGDAKLIAAEYLARGAR